MIEVVIISGPTAVGKTEKSISLALEMDAEIISCDSVQVYKYMDIGSAKASTIEREKVPHHLIDVVEPSQIFSVGEYVEQAKKILESLKSRKKNAVVVGGSGFYLKSWFGAVSDEIFIPEKIKAQCEELANSADKNAMLNALLKLDKDAPKFIDVQNPRRIRPALERVMASGLTLEQLKTRFEKLPCPYGEFHRKFIQLDLPDNELLARAKMRINKMLEMGLIEETRKLLELGIEKNPSASLAIGYRETISAIKSNDFSTLAQDIFVSTRQLIRKQRKFFRQLH